jgi:hypothetical protein
MYKISVIVHIVFLLAKRLVCWNFWGKCMVLQFLSSIINAGPISTLKFCFFLAARVINSLGAFHRHGHMS